MQRVHACTRPLICSGFQSLFSIFLSSLKLIVLVDDYVVHLQVFVVLPRHIQTPSTNAPGKYPKRLFLTPRSCSQDSALNTGRTLLCTAVLERYFYCCTGVPLLLRAGGVRVWLILSCLSGGARRRRPRRSTRGEGGEREKGGELRRTRVTVHASKTLKKHSRS